MDVETILSGEIVQVSIEAETYEQAIDAAMVRFSSFIPGAPLTREREDAAKGDWFVSGVMGFVSLGGTRMELTVAFQRHT